MKQVTPKQIYKRWLAALRSGKYKQSRGRLRECRYSYLNGDFDTAVVSEVYGYCCLGVLQDLAVKDGGPGWNTKHGVTDDDGAPSNKILNFMGLDSEMVNHLVELNDDEVKSFAEIADVIEFEIMPATGN
jgi:hypothetical protein